MTCPRCGGEFLAPPAPEALARIHAAYPTLVGTRLVRCEICYAVLLVDDDGTPTLFRSLDVARGD